MDAFAYISFTYASDLFKNHLQAESAFAYPIIGKSLLLLVVVVSNLTCLTNKLRKN